MISIIDADSIIYIVAWHHKDADVHLGNEMEVEKSCDSIIQGILLKTRATDYLGAFSHSRNFRHMHYKYAMYKGKRPPKPEWVTKWEVVIKNHLITKWGFIDPKEAIEADDILSGVWYIINDPSNVVLCTPDKDLNQVPGYHFNYKKMENDVVHIDSHIACFNFWKQMLTGDATDNIAGIPGLGDVKASKILHDLGTVDDLAYMNCVQAQYHKYFGSFYGNIIYVETIVTVELLCPQHPFWLSYKNYLGTLVHCIRPVPSFEGSIEEVSFNLDIENFF